MPQLCFFNTQLDCDGVSADRDGRRWIVHHRLCVRTLGLKLICVNCHEGQQRLVRTLNVQLTPIKIVFSRRAFPLLQHLWASTARWTRDIIGFSRVWSSTCSFFDLTAECATCRDYPRCPSKSLVTFVDRELPTDPTSRLEQSETPWVPFVLAWSMREACGPHNGKTDRPEGGERNFTTPVCFEQQSRLRVRVVHHSVLHWRGTRRHSPVNRWSRRFGPHLPQLHDAGRCFYGSPSARSKEDETGANRRPLHNVWEGCVSPRSNTLHSACVQWI